MHWIFIDFIEVKKVILHLRAEMTQEPTKSDGEAGMSNTTTRYAFTAKGVDVIIDQTLS